MKRMHIAALATGFVVLSVGLSAAQERVEEHGDWMSWSETDPIDDQVSAIAAVDSSGGSLLIACRDGVQLQLLVVFDGERVDALEPVTFRVDRGEPVREQLPFHNDGLWTRAEMTLNPWATRSGEVPQSFYETGARRANLIVEALAGMRLVARTQDTRGVEITTQFSLSGFRSASEKVFSHCGYQPDPTAIRALSGGEHG